MNVICRGLVIETEPPLTLKRIVIEVVGNRASKVFAYLGIYSSSKTYQFGSLFDDDPWFMVYESVLNPMTRAYDLTTHLLRCLAYNVPKA